MKEKKQNKQRKVALLRTETADFTAYLFFFFFFFPLTFLFVCNQQQKKKKKKKKRIVFLCLNSPLYPKNKKRKMSRLPCTHIELLSKYKKILDLQLCGVLKHLPILAELFLVYVATRTLMLA